MTLKLNWLKYFSGKRIDTLQNMFHCYYQRTTYWCLQIIDWFSVQIVYTVTLLIINFIGKDFFFKKGFATIIQLCEKHN